MKFVGKINNLLNGKIWLVFITGLASGLPLGLTGTTLQAWYAIDGVDIVTIGFLALVGQPYVYKFLWAPFLDKFDFPNFGRRRGWMLFTQLGLIATLIAMAMCSPSKIPLALALLALTLAFISSTQDVAIDAFRTEILDEKERGIGAAMAVAGYRIAMIISGGLSLILANYIGFQTTYLIMAGLFGLILLTTLSAKEPKKEIPPPKSIKEAFAQPFKEFFSRDQAILILVFIVLYKMGDAFAGTLTTAFLLKGLGFSLVDVGLINKTVGMLTTLIGALFGGWLIIKIGLFRGLLWFGMLQAVTNILFMILAMRGADYGFMVLTICAENLAGGMGTAAFIAFLMSLCDPRYTATQFALLSAFSAIGRVFVGPVAGILVSKFGWVNFFALTVLLSLPGLLVLWQLRTNPKVSQVESPI
jgi:PAT family beta-lactamase induction signal transducer AmpG